MQKIVVPAATVLAAFLGSFIATWLASHPSLGGVRARRLGAEKSEVPTSSQEELAALKASQAHLEAEVKELKQHLAGATDLLQGPRYISIPGDSASATKNASVADRRLGGLFKAATTMATGVGCFGYTAADAAVDLNSATECSGNSACPDCFYWDLATPVDVAVTFSNCHTSRWGSYTMGTAPLGVAVRSYTFINMMAANIVTVSDGTTSYVLPARTSMVAYCHTSGATLYYPWNPSILGTRCPKGCDDTTPNDPSGAAFANAVNFPGACATADDGTSAMADVCLLGR